jgi:hypothetical protein
MKSLWNEQDRWDVRERVARLRPDSERRWGTMAPVHMLAHLSDALRMALGDLECTPKKLPIRYAPLKQLIVYWLPFPKGAPTAPELIGRTSTSWSSEMTDLLLLIDRFGRLPVDAPCPEHPAFGRLSRRAWGVLAYRHMDHHLRQFGV